MSLQETSSPFTLQAVAVVLAAVDLIVISLRLYTRHVLGQSIKIDDWFALAGFGFILALTVYFIIGISKHYIGYPFPLDFTGEEYSSLISGSLQHFWIWSLLMFPTLWLIKCSFILFYRRVLVGDKGNYKDWSNILVLSSLGLATVWSLGFGITWVCICNPVRSFWGFPYYYEPGESPCLDTWIFNRSMSISDFLIDMIILLIPIPMIWRLRLKTSRKIGVILVFLLGALAVVASILRMARIIWASDPATDTMEVDGLLVNTTVLFWGLIEADLALMAACLPTLRGLLKSRPMNSLIEAYRSNSWLRSSQRSRPNKSTREQDSLPLTNPGGHGGKRSLSESKAPHDNITLATLDSVETSNRTHSPYRS